MHDNLIQLGKRSDLYMSYESPEKLTWCSGCGDYGIRNALIQALTLEGLSPQEVMMIYDVGCNGNGSDKIGAYTFHGLHGRAISAAAGAALANTDMKVIASGGDGATFSEGIGHLVHAVRSNYPMVFMFHNNENYGLTTGQASSMTRKDCKMNAAPDGVVLEPMNAAQFVLNLKPTFVARSFSGNPEHLAEMIRAGLNHNGFAFIECMQVCTTYSKDTPQEWYWDRLREIGPDHDVNDLRAAYELAGDMSENIATGILYRDAESVPFHEKLIQRQGRTTPLTKEVEHVDISSLIEPLQ